MRAMKKFPDRERRSASVWRDLLMALGIATLTGILAAHFELHERIFVFTRRWEAFQLDEGPIAVFAFAICLVALYARRHADLRRALHDNRELARRTLAVQEEERKHLARELHDELGQYLNAIKLDARSIDGEMPGVETTRAAQRIAASADHVYGVVSGLVRRLRPAALDELGLLAALEACVGQWRQSHPALRIHLIVRGDLDDLEEPLNLAIYRIVQEGLTNCVRHASASRIDISLLRDAASPARILLEMRDDGVGLKGVPVGGSGLAGMRERVHLLGGELRWLSEAGEGVTIRAELPAGR